MPNQHVPDQAGEVTEDSSGLDLVREIFRVAATGVQRRLGGAPQHLGLALGVSPH